MGQAVRGRTRPQQHRVPEIVEGATCAGQFGRGLLQPGEVSRVPTQFGYLGLHRVHQFAQMCPESLVVERHDIPIGQSCQGYGRQPPGSRVTQQPGIAEGRDVVIAVVGGVIDTVGPAKAESERWNPEVIVESGEITSSSQVADAGLVPGFVRPGTPTPVDQDRDRVAGLLHRRGQLPDEVMEGSRPGSSKVAARDGDILVQIGHRILGEGVGHRLHPLN